VVRWCLKDLAQWLFEEFHITLHEASVGRALKAMGFCKITARPHHYAQNELAVEAFKKVSRPSWQRSVPGSRRAVP
jgi:transposase